MRMEGGGPERMVGAQMIHWPAYNCTTIVPGDPSSICSWQQQQTIKTMIPNSQAKICKLDLYSIFSWQMPKTSIIIISRAASSEENYLESNVSKGNKVAGRSREV